MARTAYLTDSARPVDAVKLPASASASLTRLLLLCGAIAGPAFVLTVLLQDYTRPGVDPRLQPLSELSLGDWGWIQITNFVLAGVLNLIYAVGIWRTLHPGRAGTWGPIFTAGYGLGLVTVGVFATDPANGFPPGVAAPAQQSVHGIIHGLGGLFTFVALGADLAVFVRFFLGRNEPLWAAFCFVSALIALLSFFIGIHTPELMARMLRLGTLGGWLAASTVAVQLLALDEADHQSKDALGTTALTPW